MRVVRVQLTDGSVMILKAEFENSTLHPDVTNAAEKTEALLQGHPQVSGTRIILDH